MLLLCREALLALAILLDCPAHMSDVNQRRAYHAVVHVSENIQQSFKIQDAQMIPLQTVISPNLMQLMHLVTDDVDDDDRDVATGETQFYTSLSLQTLYHGKGASEKYGLFFPCSCRLCRTPGACSTPPCCQPP